MQSTYLDANELAQALKIKKPTVRLWTRLGMPHLRAGRLVRFRLEDVEGWLKQRQLEREAPEAARDTH